MRRFMAPIAALAIAAALVHARATPASSQEQAGPYGLNGRAVPRPYLHMPARADGKIPLLLSETGVFKDTRNMVPEDALIPYDLAVPFWSDGAAKLRWAALPAAKIKFSPTGEWTFPKGSVFVKTFELPTDAAAPEVKRRLETRLLVCDEAGGVYGVVYKWRSDNSDADLLADSQSENIPIRNTSGEVRQQTWYYPSRKDCLTCHTALAGGVLGVKTRQMNHVFTYASGASDNELRTWNHLGLFEPAIGEGDPRTLPKLASADDVTRSVEDRARSYLDANCSQCHRPGGTVAGFDARYDTPLESQHLVNGTVLYEEGIDHARIIAPHDVWRSMAFMRANTVGDLRMPPLARETIDQRGVDLLRQWIMSLPGRDVLDPPSILPAGGTYEEPISVSLSDREPGADIRYTLDGSVPGPSDARYQKPIALSGPAVVRARAFKDGFTRSITTQQVFIVGKRP